MRGDEVSDDKVSSSEDDDDSIMKDAVKIMKTWRTAMKVRILLKSTCMMSAFEFHLTGNDLKKL